MAPLGHGWTRTVLREAGYGTLSLGNDEPYAAPVSFGYRDGDADSS